MKWSNIITWLVFGLIPPPSQDEREKRWRLSVSVFSGVSGIGVALLFMAVFGVFPSIYPGMARAGELQQQKQVLDDLRASQIRADIDRTAMRVCKLLMAARKSTASHTDIAVYQDALNTENDNIRRMLRDYLRFDKNGYQMPPCEVILVAGS